ncbi:unnamed protein product [Spirodela intermedia]|uniref:4-coumarate--CoA ligase n=1 Tax=Spirodela intermedia TaxID=51605 RepID=A0A7I8JV99_SPIIN|nr:unnamed protein product [Spirodela intermedia]CAA6673553.1 unnamed protein product [Spirodela intermedia]
MDGTIRCSANYVPLTPISFLERSAVAHADRPALVDGSRRFTWRETRGRCLRLASALAQLGIIRGDVVSVLARNIPAMYELHFGAPMAGAVLCTMNTRHDSATLSVLLKHSGARVFFVDHPFLEVAMGSLKLMSEANQAPPPLLVVISEFPSAGDSPGSLEYEDLLRRANPNFEIRWPADECDPISLNYTSGTTSSPKGVVYSHRGAYLKAIAAVLLSNVPAAPVYLWTVPMFHCNGWCMAWGVAAQAGTSICLRQHGVTNMGGAPTVLNTIANSPEAEQRRRNRAPATGKVVRVVTGGAPPPAEVLFKMEELGFEVTHSYGLTETYGGATVCAWKAEWDALPALERARVKARQGLQHVALEAVDVKDPATMESVPADGRTMGEVMFRGNTVMSGLCRRMAPVGDLAVRHSDGYIELKDRSKDIIISGGENISTIEVEAALYGHAAVLEAAVTPCAFVKLREGARVGADELIAFCRSRLPRYMAPRTVVFVEELPKTSTGKTQKFVLRDKARAMGPPAASSDDGASDSLSLSQAFIRCCSSCH